MAEKKSFEQNLKALERIVAKLEGGSVSLDEALRLFQQGRELTETCEARLKDVEAKIQELTEDAQGNLSAVEFDLPDDEDN